MIYVAAAEEVSRCDVGCCNYKAVDGLFFGEVKGLISAQLEENDKDHGSKGLLPHCSENLCVRNRVDCLSSPAEERH